MTLRRPSRWLDRSSVGIARWTHWAASILLAAMMFLTATDVCLRYVFRRPLMGSYEIIELMMGVLVALGYAYADVHKEHITIDLVITRLPKGSRILLETATFVLGLGILVVMTRQVFLYGEFLREGAEVSPSLYIPLYPFVYAVAFGCATFGLMILRNICVIVRQATVETRRCVWGGIVLGILLSGLFGCVPFLRGLVWRPEPFTVGLLGIGVMFIMLFSGMYIGLALSLLGFMGMAYVAGINSGLSIMGTTPYTTIASYGFSVIPLFILMGTLCFHSGLSDDIYYTMHKFVGHLPGGLAMATVGACAGFAAVSGSGMATAATMGKVALPEMKKYNYDVRLATGCIAAGGTMGVLIPPSTILVIYGILTQQSIGKLFLAGFIPGILEAVFYMATIFIMCKRNPLLGPRGPKASFSEKIGAFKSAWGIAALFTLVIGGIYFGVFTPAEAAGVGAFGAFLMTIVKRRFTWQMFFTSLDETVRTTAMTFVSLVGAMILGYFLAVTRLPFDLANFIATLPVDRYVILIMIIIMYLLLGAIMSIFAIVVLTVPIIFPLIEALGFDPIWFGILIVRLFEIGAITPPIGINVFVLKGVARDVPLGTIFRGIVPFFIADLFHVALLVLVPGIATFLPSLME